MYVYIYTYIYIHIHIYCTRNIFRYVSPVKPSQDLFLLIFHPYLSILMMHWKFLWCIYHRHAYTHIHTHTHTYTHIHTHTHTYTHIHLNDAQISFHIILRIPFRNFLECSVEMWRFSVCMHSYYFLLTFCSWIGGLLRHGFNHDLKQSDLFAHPSEADSEKLHREFTKYDDVM